MLTGRPPFQAATPVDTMLLVLEQDPVPPRLLNPQADRDLEMIAPASACRSRPTCAIPRPPPWPTTSRPTSPASRSRPAAAGCPPGRRRLFRETHHAAVLENWGLLWMWHSLALLVLCLADQRAPVARRHDSPGPTCLLWTRRPGRLGGDLLGAAAARRAGDVRRAADRPRLGRRA